MFYLLSPRLWIAAALVAILAFTHFYAYRLGRIAVQAKWNQQIAEQREQIIKAQQTVREVEQKLVMARQESERQYVEQKQVAAASAAATELQLRRLRDQLAARDRAAAKAAASSSRTDGSASQERDLFGKCADALVGLAKDADGLNAQVIGLQGYVKNVCQAQ